MQRIATFFLIAAAVLAADTSWTKVKDLKAHSELRIYEKGAREPINATFDEANDERIIVVVKNKETAIPKADIDRLDARPPKTPRKTTVETTSKETPADPIPHPVGGPAVPGSSSSSNIGVSGGTQGNFEVIYRRN